MLIPSFLKLEDVVKNYALYFKAILYYSIVEDDEDDIGAHTFPSIPADFLEQLKEKEVYWRYTQFMHIYFEKHVLDVIDEINVHLRGDCTYQVPNTQKIFYSLNLAARVGGDLVDHLRYAIVPYEKDILAKEKKDPIWEFKDKHTEFLVQFIKVTIAGGRTSQSKVAVGPYWPGILQNAHMHLQVKRDPPDKVCGVPDILHHIPRRT